MAPFAAVALLLAAPAHAIVIYPPPGETMLDDADATRAAVRRLVPAGTPVPAAIRLMASDRYTCVLTTLQHPRTGRPDVLWCDCGPLKVSLLVQKRWQATFALAGRTVAAVEVNVGLIAP